MVKLIIIKLKNIEKYFEMPVQQKQKQEDGKTGKSQQIVNETDNSAYENSKGYILYDFPNNINQIK